MESPKGYARTYGSNEANGLNGAESQLTAVRIERPTRLDAARRMGYNPSKAS